MIRRHPESTRTDKPVTSTTLCQSETAYVDDAVETVKRGETRRRHMLEIGEDVVLNDGERELIGELQHPVCHHGGRDGSGGIVDRGVGDRKSTRLNSSH